LWPTISLGQVEDAGRWSKYGVNLLAGRWSKYRVNLLTVRRTAKWERSALCLRKANANACKKSNQATLTGSRGRDGGARGRGRLGWERLPGRKGGRPQTRREAAREEEEEEVEGRLQIARHASPTEAQSPHCKFNATLHFHHVQVPTPRLTPRASRLAPHASHPTPHRTPRLHLPRFTAPQITPRLFPWQNLLPARAKVLLLLLLLLCSS